MEEHDHSSREEERRGSGDESERVIIPLLQAPGNLLPHRITNFFIDNILRPDFGRRKEDRDPGREPRSIPGQFAERLSGEGTSSLGGVNGAKKQEELREERRTASGESGEQCLSSDSDSSPTSCTPSSQPMLWPAWVYCTRYSDRPSSGPRSRKPKKKASSKEDKRPRTAFTAEQLQRLKAEFQTNRYLTEQRRQSLAQELGLNESQIKIWFQNKRAKIKKASGGKNGLALHLMAQGLYNHSSAAKDDKSDSE